MIQYNEYYTHPPELGTVTHHQLAMLMGIAAMQQGVGTHALEFGTLAGTTTVNLARMLPRHQIITVSLPAGTKPLLDSDPRTTLHYHKPVYFPEDVRGSITHMECDSAQLNLPPCKLGFVFIDGGHSTEYVLNDFAKTLPHLVPGAVVVFHDYTDGRSGGIVSVKLAVDKLELSHPEWAWCNSNNGLAWGRKP